MGKRQLLAAVLAVGLVAGAWVLRLAFAPHAGSAPAGASGGPPRRVNLVVTEQPGQPGRYETAFSVMGTDARLTVLAPSSQAAQRILTAAADRLQRVDRLMSFYRPDSDVSRVNREAAQGFVPVSQETLAVLRRAEETSRLTDGAFDVTYAPLSAVWKRAEQEGRMPSDEALQAVRRAVGHNKLIVTESGVRFSVPGMAVDLGGIAAGYGVDLAVEAMQAAGAAAGVVDVGGDVRLFGGPAPGERWRVQVEPPPGVDKQISLALPPCAVTTSGDYARYFSVGERRLSHIVDPRTGRPVENVPSATVVAPDCTAADALATAISVLGAQQGVALAERLPSVECLIMERQPDGTVRLHRSSGFDALVERR